MKRYQVHRASDPELNWDAAALLTGFSFAWEPRAAPQTEFRALWDEQRLHFRFDCLDDDLVLGAGGTSKERVLGSDRVEIFIAPDLSLRPYFCLEMEPRGEVLAYRGLFHRQFDWDWQCAGLELSACIEAARYTVQGSLPLATLRALGVLKPEALEFFAGVYRAEFSHKPDGSIHSGWMPWVNPHSERPDFHVPETFGVFELVG